MNDAARFARVAVAVVLAAVSLPAQAKNLYVNSTTGDDNISYAANDALSPWRTLGRAAWGNANRDTAVPSEAARAGDTVYVAPGSYAAPGTNERYGVAFNPVNSGNATDGFISFEAQGLVNLELSSSIGPVIGAASRAYIRWKGFTVDEANAPYHSDTGPVVIYDSNNIVIDGNEVAGIPADTQDNHNGLRIDFSHDVQIINNRIHGTTYSAAGWTWSHNGAGIMLYGSHDVTIEHNAIYDSNSGIFPKGLDHYNIVIRHNLIYNCYKGIRVSYSHPTLGQNLIYQNIIRNGNSFYETTPIENYGINMAEHANNYIVANNVIHDYDNGVYFGNGTFNQSNLVFRNNIISGTNNAFNAYVATAQSYTLDHQNYHGTSEWAHNGSVYTSLANWRAAISGDAASSTVDPQFVDSGGNDFRLGPLSPARDAGIDLLDLNGNSQTDDAIHQGAYITGSEIIGPLNIESPPVPPSPPQNLRRIVP